MPNVYIKAEWKGGENAPMNREVRTMTEEEIFEYNRRTAAKHGITLRKVTDSETVNSILKINVSIQAAGMTIVINNIPASAVLDVCNFFSNYFNSADFDFLNSLTVGKEVYPGVICYKVDYLRSRAELICKDV